MFPEGMPKGYKKPRGGWALILSSKDKRDVVVFATGAYNASMSSNYNRIPRPAAVLVHSGHSELVQRREQPEDLLRYDVMPERFVALG